MIEVQVGNLEKISVKHSKEGISINESLFNGEVVQVDAHTFKVYKDTKIFTVEVVDRQGKQMKLKVNDVMMDVAVTDHIDQILDKLGMNMAASTAVKDIKAPMPGAILSVMVSAGDEVQEGDQLLVLEAMKMENVIKSPGEGKVGAVHVSEKENVEKNQVLISFE